MSRSETAGQESHGVGPGEGTSEPAIIGKLRAVTGSVAIVRGDLPAAEPGVGEPVYEGDVIETGADGLVAIAFADGTAFQLYGNGRVVLDEADCRVKKSSNFVLLRVIKGLFGYAAGKLAAGGCVLIDTPFGQLRNTTSAAGFGSVAFGVFTFALVHELKADSADLAFIDNGTINYKDLRHGVFEIVTKGDHPQVIIVDDPTQTIILKRHGSGVSVEAVSNTPEQMARLEHDYSDAYSHYSQGLQDPTFQQWNHAYAQPQSTGPSGSSTSDQILLFQTSGFNPGQQNNINTGGENLGGHGQSGPTNSSGSSSASGGSGPTPTPTAYWNGEGDDKTWGDPSNWSDSWAPLYNATLHQDLVIDISGVIVTIDSDDEDSGPGPTAVLDLTIGGGVVLNIESGGSLTIFGTFDDSGLIKANSTGSDPTLTIEGPVTVFTGGEIEALGNNSTVTFQAASGDPPITIDNSGTIAAVGVIPFAGSGAAVFVEQAITTNETHGLITANTLGAITFDQGSINNSGILEAGTIGFVTLNQTTVTNQTSGQIDAAAGGVLTFEQGSLDNSGTWWRLDQQHRHAGRARWRHGAARAHHGR
jgi:hypothetical protein